MEIWGCFPRGLWLFLLAAEKVGWCTNGQISEADGRMDGPWPTDSNFKRTLSAAFSSNSSSSSTSAALLSSKLEKRQGNRGENNNKEKALLSRKTRGQKCWSWEKKHGAIKNRKWRWSCGGSPAASSPSYLSKRRTSSQDDELYFWQQHLVPPQHQGRWGIRGSRDRTGT